MAAFFNAAQLVTWDQARELATQLTALGIGRGVKPESGDMDQSGLYTELWSPGPGGFPEPNGVDPKTGKPTAPILMRFNNGAAGVNVGLVLDKFKRFPSSPQYVLRELGKEVDSMAVAD